MKKILLFICILSFYSCKEKEPIKQEADVKSKYMSWSCDVKVVDIDSCEYILAQTGSLNGGLSIVHKQNCKYCISR